MFAFLYVTTNSKEICEEISFSSFLRKCQHNVLSRFKANYLEKFCGFLHFPLWIPIALAKIYFFRLVLTWRKKKMYLVGTVLKYCASKLFPNLLSENSFSYESVYFHHSRRKICRRRKIAWLLERPQFWFEIRV